MIVFPCTCHRNVIVKSAPVNEINFMILTVSHFPTPICNFRSRRVGRYMRLTRPSHKSGLRFRKPRVDSTLLSPPAVATAADRPPKPDSGGESIPYQFLITRSFISDSFWLPVPRPSHGGPGGTEVVNFVVSA